MDLQPASAHTTRAAPPPLSDTEAARLRRQIAGLRHIDARDRLHAQRQWDFGHFCKRVRDEGLWQRSAEHRAASFLDFVCAVTSLRSRSTVERRLLLVEHFSREEFLEYVSAGTGATALCEIARTEEALRPELLRRARAPEGLTVAQVTTLREAGRAELVRQERRALQAARRGEDEAPELRLRRCLDEALAAARQGARRPARQPERRRQMRAAATTAEEREASSGAAVAEGAAAAPEGAARRAWDDQEEAARRAGLAERAAALGREEAALNAREEELRCRQATLGARLQLLAAREATVRTEAPRELAAPDAAAPAPAATEAKAAETAERGAREAELGQRAAALDAREAELGQRTAALDAREAELMADAVRLGEAERTVGEDREDLAFHRDRVAEEERRQAEDRARLDRERFAYFRWLAQEGRVSWPEDPWHLDGTLLCAAQLCERLVDLARHADRQINVRSQLPEEGGMDVIYSLKTFLDRAGALWRKALGEVGRDYKTRYPGRVADFFQRLDDASGRGAQPALPPAQAPRLLPEQQFALPTRAILGAAAPHSPQHGVLGLLPDRSALLTLDLNGVQTVGVFGQQNAGKSHTLLALTENALATTPNISVTPAPLCVIHCHFHPDPDGPGPGYGSFLLPNDEEAGVAVLRGELGARPRGLPARRRLVFVPPMDEDALARRRAELPGFEVQELRLSARELGMEGLKLLMGAGGGASLYMMKIHHALQGLRDPSPAEFQAAIRGVKLSAGVREIVEERLRLIDRIVGQEPLGARIGPGDFVGLDMRAPWVDEGVALSLFAVAMNAFAAAKTAPQDGGARFRKMMVFDEAHKYMGKGALSADILRLVREMRHRDTWVVYASQDPESVHPALIKLSSVLVLHQMKGRSSVKVLREHFAGCEGLDPTDLAQMGRGEAQVLAVDCADPTFRLRPQRLLIRPTCARPAGTTRPATM